MQKKHIHISINFVTAIAVTLFFSCTSMNKKAEGFQISDDAPVAEGLDINLKYTDSGRLTAIMKTSRVLDFTNRSFGYREFPEGVILDLIDEQGKVSVVKADYAIVYERTGLIDMRGNVDVRTADSTHLQAQQLYYDQKRSWVFTDQPYNSRLSNGGFNEGSGFDANQDFTILNSRTNKGIQILEE